MCTNSKPLDYVTLIIMSDIALIQILFMYVILLLIIHYFILVGTPSVLYFAMFLCAWVTEVWGAAWRAGGMLPISSPAPLLPTRWHLTPYISAYFTANFAQ